VYVVVFIRVWSVYITVFSGIICMCSVSIPICRSGYVYKRGLQTDEDAETSGHEARRLAQGLYTCMKWYLYLCAASVYVYIVYVYLNIYRSVYVYKVQVYIYIHLSVYVYIVYVYIYVGLYTYI
jgi:hypothetical protein